LTIRRYAALALCFSVLTAGVAVARTPPHAHHVTRHAIHRSDVRYAQGFYDYRAASAVREEFRDDSRARWHRDGRFDQGSYREGREGMVVENLRSGDFTGGVGYGLDGDVPSFVDGFGQTHFFVGSFRRMAPVPGRFGAPRPGFHGRFR
jgi:hypothetical protein